MPTGSTNTTPSFNLPRTGFASVDIGTRSLTVQSDGKLVLGGYSGNDFSVVRLNADGSLDSNFSGNGKAVIDVGGYSDEATSIVVQSDGKLVLAGYSTNSGSTDYSVVRLNADGSLDTGFSGDGKAVIDVGGNSDQANSMVVQPDGKVVLAGYSTNSGSTDYSVVRLNADGSLDAGFSGDGKAAIDMGGPADFANSVVVQSDGKLVLGGYSYSSSTISYDFSVVRLNADGSLDRSFSGDGKAVIGVSDNDKATSVVVQSDGKVVLGGYSNSYFSVVRLNADGSLDSNFSGDGKALIDLGGSGTIDKIYSMVVQSDGKLVLGGIGGANVQGAVVRLNADGSLDTSFGDTVGGGNVYTSLGGSVAYTEQAAPIILDTSVVITDPELAALNSGAGNYTGASITLARAGGASTQDVFSGSGALSLTGSSAVLSGTTVGSVSNSGGTLTITFNAAATQAVVNQTLSSLAYSNRSNAPPASVQIEWKFSDGNSDDTQGTGGTLSTTGSTTVNITAVNDAPTASNRTLTGTEDTAYTLTVADFGFSDVDTGDALQSVTITRLSNAGSLKLNDTAVTLNQVISAADIDTGKLVFTPATNANGTACANWGFKVSDGKALSASAYTMTINVTAVNDAPTGGVTITGAATQGQTLTAANTLADVDGLGTIAYQWWLREGKTINGATGNSYTLTAADVNKGVFVRASYTDTGGTTENVTSSSTVNITAVASLTKTGTAGNDTLSGGLGNDTLSGGDGIDTALFAYAKSAHTITKTSTGLTVSSTQEGTDTLTGMERLAFSDVKVAFDLDGTAGTTAMLMGSLLGKASLQNKALVGTVLGMLDAGQVLAGLSQLVVNNGIAATLAGDTSNSSFVKLLLRNVVGSDTDNQLVNSLTNLLDSGTFTQASMLTAAAQLDANKLHIDLVGLSQTGLEFI